MAAPTRPMVNPVEAVVRGFAKYASFGGRATRAEWWWWTLFFTIGTALANAIGDALDRDFPYVLFALAVLLPTVAVTARRLHDTGRTGWWQVAWWGTLVPAWLVATRSSFIFKEFEPREWERPQVEFDLGLVHWVIELPSPAQTVLMIFVLVFFTAEMLAWVAFWMARKGEPGDNQFGPDPRANV